MSDVTFTKIHSFQYKWKFLHENNDGNLTYKFFYTLTIREAYSHSFLYKIIVAHMYLYTIYI